MAPRGSVQRRQTQSQNEHVFALGKVGRKTGITIPDNGRRDEHGFEELDNLFSSPDRELLDATNGRNPAVSEDEQDEQDMEIDDGSELGPATTRKLQQSRPSLPRARSPIKTNLKSPARHNPHLQPTSSPTRGTIVTERERSPKPEVKRRLDFSKSSQDQTMAASSQAKATTNGHHKVRKIIPAQPSRSTEQSIFSSDPPNHIEDEPEEEEDEDEHLELLDAGAVDDGGYVEDDLPEEPEEEVEEEEEAPIVQETKSANKSKPPPGRRGRKPKTTVEKGNDEPVDTSLDDAQVEAAEEDEEPVKKRKGRPKATSKPEREAASPADPNPPPKASKRGRKARTSTEDVEDDSAELRDAKRQKTSAKAVKAEKGPASKSAPVKEKSKPGRKRKSSGVSVDSPVIQHGPPLPKSRGLVTLRREETAAMRTTRSGRASFKPLEWWKGDHIEYDEDQENLFEDSGKRHFKMRSVKGVVRAEESEEPGTRRRGRPATGRKPGRRPPTVVEEEVERDDWEFDPGRVAGEVVLWQPEHELEPPEEDDQVEIEIEELAISEQAIQLKDIKDATFKFAKTLTLPFFGAGVVDLPPGAEKRTKNTRMRHMVFFVHTGNVQVTIAQTEFGIANGGMFFVPRGNTYSILNETDRPARIFFAQGCEILSPLAAEGEA
ncbi:Mif2/CENP-C like-domain-containing protein [Xylaria bambusicola]|uniref:Mif2/CENP-C like-domain-containing protein n=1 Tax=Xylaria bambusicola TaxID=326684 RepID=UPI002007BE31|nr:Mif2/CENP-C like-domain-containing protein [Xylaria bambusicola]KAI0518452.1 Mif2/CENP-C like-domain-containing protein [Xylaria bambusicola]